MDVCEEPSGKSANAVKEELPSSQHLKNRGCMHSPVWKKAVVYDCVEQTAKVLKEKDIDKRRCQKFDLPKRKQVTIFVDAKPESKPTTASKGPGGNVGRGPDVVASSHERYSFEGAKIIGTPATFSI